MLEYIFSYLILTVFYINEMRRDTDSEKSIEMHHVENHVDYLWKLGAYLLLTPDDVDRWFATTNVRLVDHIVVQ